MSKISVWVVMANDDSYAHGTLSAQVSSNKMKAIEMCFQDLRSKYRDGNKPWLDRQKDEIVKKLMQCNEYEQRDDGLFMIAELQSLDIHVN